MEKVKNSLNVSIPTGGFVDEGDGVVSFPNGLTITDGTVQRNGTRYDIDSLDISRYGGQLTGDHKDELGNLIGEVIGTVKRDGKVVVNKIRYAVNENPYARLAYNLFIGGFSKNFSTETIGPHPDEMTGIYWNSELVGLSQVVTQNNYNAHVNKFNEVVHNSLEQSKKDGLDVEHNTLVQKFVNSVESAKEEKMEDNKNKKEETLKVEEVSDEKSTKVQAPAVEEAGENGEKIVETPHVPETEETEEKAENKAEEKTNESEEAEKAKNEVEEEAKAEEPTEEEEVETEKNETSEKETEEVSEEEKETNKKEEKMSKEENSAPTLTIDQVTEAIANALKPVSEELASVRAEAKNAFDKSAKEPEFKKGEEKAEAKNAIEKMSFRDRYQAQVAAAWNYVKLGNIEAGQTLRQINAMNFEALKEKGFVGNAITLEDLGNFVVAPEMQTEIIGKRNNYTPLLNATEWRETDALEFAWQKRVGDIDMQPVALYATEADPDANLKPISEYGTEIIKTALEELAAVTVIANSTTRFYAADILADAAAGYRKDYDRKRAELVIARLEQAIDETGYSTAYNPASDVDALTAVIDAITEISDTTLEGTLIFNNRTFAEIKSRALKAGANGPLSEILTTGDLPTLFGYRFIVVSNDLMPSLGGSESISHLVDGVNVPINHAVYFADLDTFTGRTSGGLQYDVSNQAPYEVGGVVKSAYQRNELVLRGSFFRAGAVRDVELVSGIRQGAGANVS